MDNRNILSGSRIKTGGYSDQPYVVRTDDNAWLLAVTTGSGLEGDAGQHILSARSTDKGKTWGDYADVESPQNPESSYAVLYKTKFGRVYCFYNYNKDNIRAVKTDMGETTRVDTQGYFVFKYSDDNGLTWSEQYREIPIRKFNVDLNNPYGGEICYFWNVGKPLAQGDGVLVPLYKIGGFGPGFMHHSECALLYCENIDTESDPDKLRWTTLPDGMDGIRAPLDLTDVSEEHSFVRLSDGTIFCVFRTTTGHSYCSYSRDNAHTFSPPEPMRYADGRLINHPRAANFIWDCGGGKYLYWFHNNMTRWYDNRNIAWLSGAVEYMTDEGMKLKFSQPDIVLYTDDRLKRISYPDLIIEDGEYYITETEKNAARVHKIDKTLIENLWRPVIEDDSIAIKNGDKLPPHKPFIKQVYDADDNYSVDTGEGSFAIRFTLNRIPDGNKTLLTNGGISIEWHNGKLRFCMSDGHCNASLDITADGTPHDITFIIDGGPRVIMAIVDTKLVNGDINNPFGWGRFDRYMQSVTGGEVTFGDEISGVRYYNRLLTVSEGTGDAVAFEKAPQNF